MTTTTERLARLETAQELLGFLIASLSSEIHAERQKTAADPAAVEALQAKKNELADLEDRLSLDDVATVERVIQVLGPEVKSQFLSGRKVAADSTAPVALSASA